VLLSDQLKIDVKNYLINFDVNNSFGVTLTLQQGIKNQKLDKISSSQNLRHFLNVLNQKCFGNQFKLPIVNDGIEYKDDKKKSDGYSLKDGKRSVKTKEQKVYIGNVSKKKLTKSMFHPSSFNSDGFS